MKIHSISQRTLQHRFGVDVLRLLAVCGVAILGAVTSMSVRAQSPEGQITHGSEAYRVVSSSNFRTAADVGRPARSSQPTQQVGFLDRCKSCGTGCGGSCGSSYGSYGSCGSCGMQCGGACGGGHSPFSNFGNPCAPCDPYYYVLAETLYMERDGEERFTLSPNYNMGGFDHELGSRFTIGSVPDCVHGWEASFTGPFEWDMAGGLIDLTGNLQTFLTAGAPLVATDLSAFNDNVNASGQTYTADYWSLEASRTLVGWDVAKLLIGARYIDYDENYNYLSQNNSQVGLLHSDVQNQLIGLQAGLDLLYPISKHGYADFRGRIGGFLNLADSDVRLLNDGTTLIANVDDDEDIAGMFEIGTGIRYQLGPVLSVRAGVELWYLAGVATAQDQFRSVVSPNTSGRKTQTNDEVLMTGASLGAELRF